MVDFIGNVFFIIFGLALAILHKVLAEFAIARWRKYLRIPPPRESGYQIIFLAIGIIFVICGTLGLLRIFK